jgi:FtsP/CotA-like multicopper oxidase with cupredoxin domain
MNRRSFLASSSVVLTDQMLSHGSPTWTFSKSAGKVRTRYTLRIEPCKLEIAPGMVVDTIGYNGQVPGPILRVREGVPVSIDVTNNTANADIVHWHGLAIDSLNDGAMEEGSSMIPAGGTLRYHFTPRPAGTRWYHTHVGGGANLHRRLHGPIRLSSGRSHQDPGHYDQEIFLAIHHWEPSFVPMVETMREASANAPLTPGSDVGYKYATMNQHMLGAGLLLCESRARLLADSTTVSF